MPTAGLIGLLWLPGVVIIQVLKMVQVLKIVKDLTPALKQVGPEYN